MRSKEESEKASLKPNIQNTKITAPGPITSWQIEGEKVEAVMDFPFLGSKITADSDCSREIKRCLLLGRKAMANLDSVLKKQRHHFASKGLYGKRSYSFSSSHKQMWELKLSLEEMIPSNHGVGKDFWTSHEFQDQTCQY